MFSVEICSTENITAELEIPVFDVLETSAIMEETVVAEVEDWRTHLVR